MGSVGTVIPGSLGKVSDTRENAYDRATEYVGKQKARIWCVALGALAPTILATAELIRTLVER
jgi:hypothetical protein